MTDTSSSHPARHANGRFGPGNPGRPVGSRNRISRRVALALLDHFEARPEVVLARLVRDPALYFQVIACLLPRRPIVRDDVAGEDGATNRMVD